MVIGSSIYKQSSDIVTRIRSFPRRYYVVAGVSLVMIIATIVAVWPRHATFSYAAPTCFFQPTLFPAWLRSSSSTFTLVPSQEVSIGTVSVAALQLCAVPATAPTAGRHAETVALAVLPWLSVTYGITVPPPPSVSVAAIGQPLSVKKGLDLPLSEPDAVFSYKVRAGDASRDCRLSGQRIDCDIPGLSLKQGSEYALAIDRYFKGKKIGTAANRTVKTLAATTITKVSVTSGQVVYDKPKSIELIADKPLDTGTIVLERIEGDTRTRMPTQARYDGDKALVSWTDDLPRRATYELVASSLLAKDGSGLDGAYSVRFETSGGPKVKSVSVGSSKVPIGATATITFDQPILASQDISGIITATGGATVTGKKGAQVFVSFAGVPRCGGVTLAVSDALLSEHGIAGGSTWKQATRVICQAVGSIGTSAKGRPIASYSFGGGPSTVLYTGAIHGNESSTRALMLRWIDELEANPGMIPVDKTIVVVPALNPDGVASGTRTNAKNVDLNRNFATADWKSDITTVTNAPFPGGGGASALSEPESKALAEYVGRTRPRLVLSYHSVGGLVAANQSGDSVAQAASYARSSGYANTTGSSDAFEYGISGTADDYYGQVLGVPSVLIELGSHTDPQFARNRDAMWAMMR